MRTLTAPLVDNLPAGITIAASPDVNTTCGGAGALLAVAGGSSVTLPSGRTIPANSSCTLSVNVTGANTGNFINVIPVGALQTDNGNNQAPAIATLVITLMQPPQPLVPVPVLVPVPTLSSLALMLLGEMLISIGLVSAARRV